MTTIQLTEMLGWLSIINIGILLVSTLALVTLKSKVIAIHSKMFGLPEEQLPALYFKYLANYKVLLTLFILTPYIALKILGY